MPDNGMTREQADTIIEAIGTLDKTLEHLTAATLLGAFNGFMLIMGGGAESELSEAFLASYGAMLQTVQDSFRHDFLDKARETASHFPGAQR
jgi:hypothetical protein